jgi:DNA-binding NarL/FixJ family response regulator
MTPRECLTPKEIQIAILVWEGLTNREIGRIIGTSEQVIKNHLRNTLDQLGVWTGWNWPCTSPAWRKELAGSPRRARPLSPGGGS